ncbi:hypothetical protein MEQ_02796 [Candida albicans P87]|uniref:Uncharacterized protein n=1 Tax=Candida albicans (strain WO-1) TaxID=294748 RepID=C4YQD0_CANAW|nr:conserved hypothetical protein [Candida albicans WO-1]KGQ98199.1 hypothetical protein MG1_02841 [Candida albicans GC75]KGU10224.1 hypothetical protein MEQ_02796 [Candida albicans P87]KGU27229.1 hypothetical protein MG7_02839 [Candida albicans P34048]KGU31199.1 hypothetical protein MGM_02824 [Candida albicans P75063]KGU31932.1 hypothetical protein MGK_02824 [Candida albicans P57055]KHC55578.1 hypothetical protein MGC_02828 [Candida albicans P37039]RLP64060.1 hypothetical protein L150_02798
MGFYFSFLSQFDKFNNFCFALVNFQSFSFLFCKLCFFFFISILLISGLFVVYFPPIIAVHQCIITLYILYNVLYVSTCPDQPRIVSLFIFALLSHAFAFRVVDFIFIQ